MPRIVRFPTVRGSLPTMIALCLGAVVAPPCFAQIGGGGPMNGGTGMMGAGQGAAKHNEQQKPEPAAPPVLPGTKAASEPAAPTQSPADMSPTDALFDAINRGDLAAARDAVNRGANMDGQNLLGLTPLDLSVDLGRNDISFMLMSMRSDDIGSHQVAAQKDAPRRESASSKSAARPRAVAAFAADEDATAPRLYTGNGGAPIPAAGFVGFDGGRTVR